MISIKTLRGILFVMLGGLFCLSAFGTDTGEADRCIERLVQAQCPVPGEVQQFLKRRLAECLHVENAMKHQSLEVLVMKPRQSVVVVQTDGAYHWRGYCQVSRYSLNTQRVKDIKVSHASKSDGEVAVMVSDVGQVYVLRPDRRFFELTDSQGKPYRAIKTLLPEADGAGMTLVYGSKQAAKTVFTAELMEKSVKRQLATPDPYWSLAGIEE